jgi:hypothetical protein
LEKGRLEMEKKHEYQFDLSEFKIEAGQQVNVVGGLQRNPTNTVTSVTGGRTYQGNTYQDRVYDNGASSACDVYIGCDSCVGY